MQPPHKRKDPSLCQTRKNSFLRTYALSFFSAAAHRALGMVCQQISYTVEDCKNLDTGVNNKQHKPPNKNQEQRSTYPTVSSEIQVISRTSPQVSGILTTRGSISQNSTLPLLLGVALLFSKCQRGIYKAMSEPHCRVFCMLWGWAPSRNNEISVCFQPRVCWYSIPSSWQLHTSIPPIL